MPSSSTPPSLHNRTAAPPLLYVAGSYKSNTQLAPDHQRPPVAAVGVLGRMINITTKLVVAVCCVKKSFQQKRPFPITIILRHILRPVFWVVHTLQVLYSHRYIPLGFGDKAKTPLSFLLPALLTSRLAFFLIHQSLEDYFLRCSGKAVTE